jgi:CRP-like cAMP-binding protein
LGQGDYFGEKGILSKDVRNASISSLEEVKLLSLSEEALEELMEEYPHLFEELEKGSLDRTG